MHAEHHEATLSAVVVKVLPSGGVSTLLLFGVPVSIVIQVLTMVFLCLQIGWFIYERFIKPKEVPDGCKPRPDEPTP